MTIIAFIFNRCFVALREQWGSIVTEKRGFIKHYDEKRTVSNIKFENITINGRPFNPDRDLNPPKGEERMSGESFPF